VFEQEELAVQQRFNGGNRSLGLHNVSSLGHFVLDLVQLKPRCNGFNFGLGRLYNSRNAVDVEVLSVARRAAGEV
jgi:hypothetical protein